MCSYVYLCVVMCTCVQADKCVGIDESGSYGGGCPSDNSAVDLLDLGGSPCSVVTPPPLPLTHTHNTHAGLPTLRDMLALQ